ncbi:TPA: hypothetical protein K8E49_002947 [Listeria monocytogenes]|uniref:hypothetical protein n=1 Tax=Listeria monocytogenes TaxID=1639 RepID=UPI000BE765D3|nr:hypothetical protein [Listeria monocytogenes]EAH1035577.1 hypothetical protein [Listeria monocytogenes]PDR00302.1 hypothetical protein A0I97_09000 [Listeria monocytogenes]HBI6091510.1 hypothetical protein [Listeria monocytogenes]HBI6464175.1 hypothetical protein [Listeria monocytogenes]HBI7371458.1 hypothetical protein [Listeria monocytogenes]
MVEKFSIPGMDNVKAVMPDFSLPKDTGLTGKIKKINEEHERERQRLDDREERKIELLEQVVKNTASLKDIVDLIQTSNDNQEVMLTALYEILKISEAKTKKEADSKLQNVLSKISSNAELANNLAQLTQLAVTIHGMLPL